MLPWALIRILMSATKAPTIPDYAREWPMQGIPPPWRSFRCLTTTVQRTDSPLAGPTNVVGETFAHA